MIEDGLTEIYVNTQIDDGSLVAELMKEFMLKNPNNEKFKNLTNKSKELKNRGGKQMNAVLKEYFKEDLIEAEEKGENKTLFTLVKDGLITKSQAMDRSSDKKAFEAMFEKE